MLKLNDQKLVEIDADIFVIPNRAYTIYEYENEDTVELIRSDIDRALKLNDGLAYYANDKLVELWWTERSDDEDRCDNLCRHTFFFTNEKGVKEEARLDYELVPQSWIENMKEGDTIELILPLITRKGYDDIETGKYNAKINIRAKQRGYRYSGFGNFEDILNDVLHIK